MSAQQWYVKVDSRTLGPLSTDLVLRGLADGELPASALVCRAGAYSWLPLSSVPPFSGGTVRPSAGSGLPPGAAPCVDSGHFARAEVREAYQALRRPGGLRAAAASAADAGLGFSRVRGRAMRTVSGAHGREGGTGTEQALEDAELQRVGQKLLPPQLLPPPEPSMTPPAARVGLCAPVSGGLLDSDDFVAEGPSVEAPEAGPPSKPLAVGGVGADHASEWEPASGLVASASARLEGAPADAERTRPTSERRSVETKGHELAASLGMNVIRYESTQQHAIASLTDDACAAVDGDSEPIRDLQPLLEPDEPARVGANAHADAGFAGDTGSAKAQVAADPGASPGVRLAPTWFVPQGQAARGNDAGEAQPQLPAQPVQDIDDSDFADVFEAAIETTDTVLDADAWVATLRSTALDSAASNRREVDGSSSATAAPVVSETVEASQAQPVGETAQPDAVTVDTGGDLVPSASAGRDADDDASGVEPARHTSPRSVPKEQSFVVDAGHSSAQLLQEPRVATPPIDNPFMTAAAAALEPSALARPEVPFGRNELAVHAYAPGSATESDIERAAKAVNWSQQFCDYFQVGELFELPDQRVLLRSLELAPLDVLVQPEAMWNLAVCLALGADALATVAADSFFRIMMAYPDRDRLAWMARVLLSRGFLPSGIPVAAGERAVRLLQARCPAELQLPLGEVLAG